MNDNNQYGHQDDYQSPRTPSRPRETGDTSVMSVKDWVITSLIMMIPCVGIIMTFVWAFSSDGNLNKKNYARATLIIMAISIVLGLILYVAFFAAIFAAAGLL